MEIVDLRVHITMFDDIGIDYGATEKFPTLPTHNIDDYNEEFIKGMNDVIDTIINNSNDKTLDLSLKDNELYLKVENHNGDNRTIPIHETMIFSVEDMNKRIQSYPMIRYEKYNLDENKLQELFDKVDNFNKSNSLDRIDIAKQDIEKDKSKTDIQKE